jgi:hypothetical protein
METELAHQVHLERTGQRLVWCWFFAALLSTLFHGQEAAGRADSSEWIAAKNLVQQIQSPTPTLSEQERSGFLAKFEKLLAQHETLEADEQNLVTRLTADQRDLKNQAELLADYNNKSSAWQDSLKTHNERCNRTFTNPADVAQCDQSGARLAQEKNDLDAQEAKLAKQAAELHSRQSADVALAGELNSNYATWDNSLEPEFNAPLRIALARKIGTTTLRLTVKSFIKTVDVSSMSAEARRRGAQVFAWITNANVSENPMTPSPDSGDYRLWSQVAAVVSCRGDTITSWRTSNLAHRGGTELRILDSETSVLSSLNVTPSPQGTDDRKDLNFSYAIKGKPNDAVLPSLQVVQPRTCYNIWHRVRAVATCRNGVAQLDTQLSGSRFPSHRVWINEDVKTTIDQGPFSNLWDCDPSAPDMVR